ncbi:hypothetical protein [Hoeflea sp.]|uniref:hypothetical protein n=1 Tax=Hoeflea sp. TaxID=1940281 RepID=UPI0025C39466|nr:hypothetical protein [Hoeflea sp.]
MSPCLGAPRQGLSNSVFNGIVAERRLQPPRVCQRVRREGHDIARFTVERLMKIMELQGVVRGKKVIRPPPVRPSRASGPSSALRRATGPVVRQPPSASQRFTLFREQPSSRAICFEPHPPAQRHRLRLYADARIMPM